MNKLVTIAVLAALAGSPAAAKEKKNPLDDYVRTGEIVQCVPMRSTGIDAADDTHLIFKVGPGRVYLNETRSNCSRAADTFSRFEFQLYGDQACSGEFVKVVDNQSGFFLGACTLGAFEKLERKPAATTEAGKE